jgi:hypothetical protein
MKTTKTEKNKELIREIISELDSLSKDLDYRISDLHNIKGGAAERHAFCYYRKQIWECMYKLRDNVYINL